MMKRLHENLFIVVTRRNDVNEEIGLKNIDFNVLITLGNVGIGLEYDIVK
jgi:hypothetical protein